MYFNMLKKIFWNVNGKLIAYVKIRKFININIIKYKPKLIWLKFITYLKL